MVWVRSPVKMMKSGVCARALTAATAFGKVPVNELLVGMGRR